MEPILTIGAIAAAITGVLALLKQLWNGLRKVTRILDTVERIDSLVSHNLRNHDSEPLYKTVSKLERDVELLKRAIHDEQKG